jgi:hypothetical protein
MGVMPHNRIPIMQADQVQRVQQAWNKFRRGESLTTPELLCLYGPLEMAGQILSCFPEAESTRSYLQERADTLADYLRARRATPQPDPTPQPPGPVEPDVHTEHCCAEHGCKYGDPACTVTTGQKPQRYPCESCGLEREGY